MGGGGVCDRLGSKVEARMGQQGAGGAVWEVDFLCQNDCPLPLLAEKVESWWETGGLEEEYRYGGEPRCEVFPKRKTGHGTMVMVSSFQR